MSERGIKLQRVINAGVEAALRALPKLAPARVHKWDVSKQRADVQVLIKNVSRDEDDARVTTSVPIVTGVPIIFLGAGGYRITCPISDGNTVIDGQTAPATRGALIWSHVSLDKWLSGTGGEVDPELDHSHGDNDAIFIPGLNPFGAAWSSFPTDHMTIGADGGQQLHFHNSTIVAGDEATAQFVALADKVDNELTKISTTLASLTGGATTPATFTTPYSKGSTVGGSVFKAKP